MKYFLIVLFVANGIYCSLAQSLFKDRAYVPEDVTNTTLIIEILPVDELNSGVKLTNSSKYQKFLAKQKEVASKYKYKFIMATAEEIQSDPKFLDNKTYKYVLASKLYWKKANTYSPRVPIAYGIRFEEVFIDPDGLRRSSYGLIPITGNVTGNFHHLKKIISVLNKRG
ncbi:MAG TPA: hypothetical protein EYN69_03895 [Flavobacteriales bacterium]|nr:hypothetical protein [Flavobacteriales bacterium]